MPRTRLAERNLWVQLCPEELLAAAGGEQEVQNRKQVVVRAVCPGDACACHLLNHLRVIRRVLLRDAVALGRICLRLRIRHVHRHRLGTVSRRLIVSSFGWIIPGGLLRDKY